MVNLVLLDKIILKIRAQPELWVQEMFRSESDCGTAFCVAGHAVAMTHGDPGIFGPPEGWWSAGRQALGLTSSQGNYLFAGGNTFEEIEAYRDRLAADPNDELHGDWQDR